MDDEATEIQLTLTSTMGNVLLSHNNDKNDANDSTPTSSTDAASTCSKTPLNATDDPISSTSSEFLDKNKGVDIKGVKKDVDMAKSQAMSDSDVDLLDMNIGNVSTEPINEEMEDIVQDLQKILGEAESIDDLPSKRKAVHDSSTDEKFLSALDDLGTGEFRDNEQPSDKQIEISQDIPDKKVDLSEKTSDKECQESLNKESSQVLEIHHEILEKNIEISQDVAVEKKDETDACSIEKPAILSKVLEISSKDECLKKQDELEKIPEEFQPPRVECDKFLSPPLNDNVEITEIQSKHDSSSQMETCSEDTATNETVQVNREAERINEPCIEKVEDEIQQKSQPDEEKMKENLSEAVIDNKTSCDSDEDSTRISTDEIQPAKIQDKKNDAIIEEITEISTPGTTVDIDMCTKEELGESETIQEETLAVEETKEFGESETIQKETLAVEETKELGESETIQDNSKKSEEIEEKHEEQEVISIAPDTKKIENDPLQEITESETEASKGCMVENVKVTENIVIDTPSDSVLVEKTKELSETEPENIELIADLAENQVLNEKKDVETENLQKNSEDFIEEPGVNVTEPSTILEKESMEMESETVEDHIQDVASEINDTLVEISSKTEDIEKTDEIRDATMEEAVKMINLPSSQTQEEFPEAQESAQIEENTEVGLQQESVHVNEMENTEVGLQDTTETTPSIQLEIEENKTVSSVSQNEDADISEREASLEKATPEVDDQPIVQKLPEDSKEISEERFSGPVQEDTPSVMELVQEEDQETLIEQIAEPIVEEPPESPVEEICAPPVVELDETSQVLLKEDGEKEMEEPEMVSEGVAVEEQPEIVTEEATVEEQPAEVIAEATFEEQPELVTEEATNSEVKRNEEQDSKSEVLLDVNMEKSEDQKITVENLPKEQDFLDRAESVVESDGSKVENIESLVDSNVSVAEISTEAEEPIPVVEEIVVKKTIIYEHDCHHHKEKEHQTMENTEDNIESHLDLKPEEIQESQIEDLEVPQETMEVNEVSKEEILTDPSAISEAVLDSSRTSPPKNLAQNEVDEAVKHIVLEDRIHDQTTAAVQSILDNMLAEEQNVVEIAEKEEVPVVHSSYSSYELAKAVQQIQDTNISPVEEITGEEISFVEKQTESNEEENIVNNTVKEFIREEIKETPVQKVENFDSGSTVKQQDIKEIIEEIKPETLVRNDAPVQKQPEVSIVKPSIDLSEESSSEESLEEDTTQNKISSTTSTDVSKEVELKTTEKKTNLKETRSSRNSEKCKDKGSINEPLSINVEETEKEKSYSPRITIKPIREEEPIEEREEHKGSLKITITKQSDNTHSILKICSPDMEQRHAEEPNPVVPKLVIKTADVDQHSPKMSTRSSKQITTNASQRSGSPRITIKPIPKPPETKDPVGSPLKITIKPLGKPEEFSKQQQQRHSPKLPRCKLDDDHYGTRSKVLKTSEMSEIHSPKLTIKPVVKPDEKPDGEAKISPKITIKPLVKPDDEPEKRIVLKINKGTIPNEKISRKREHDDDKSEKLAKIKLKFSKGGDAHIVHEEKHKRGHDAADTDKCKRLKVTDNSDEDVKIIEDRQSPIVISEDSRSQDSVILVEDHQKDPLSEHDIRIAAAVTPTAPVQPPGPKKRGRPRKVPLVIRDDFANIQSMEVQNPAPPPPPPPVVEQTETETTGRPKRSCRGQSVRDTLGIKPRKPKAPPKVRGGKRGGATRGITKKSQKELLAFSEEKIDLIKQSLTEEAVHVAQSTGGGGGAGLSKLAKKNPPPSAEHPVGQQQFELKGLLRAAKDQNIIEVIEIDSPSNSPKSIDAAGNLPIEESPDISTVDITASDVEMQPPTPVIVPHLNESTAMDIGHSSDIAIFEEETRMSADVNSRAQTPAKQVVSSDVVVEESQSSMQSTATTESGKISRKSRLEVHQEPDAAIVTADQLNEYYWGGNGPFMIQEQVAQFLGIKSFKRKYPGLPRRMVDMQERDYIRENGLASESMCDLGLTAVNSADILDIMYSDFQDKYEEYCKYQRDKQAKDLINKQKAMALATGQEKNKLDIMEQAIQSAASYNANFNKLRKEQRRACMDLQTMNVHYPKGKMKPVVMPKIGYYPVAVVPGQYTDYYKEFTPTDLNNLPLNTMLYKELHRVAAEGSDSETDTSGSDSDESSSSDSDSDSSCDDGCKMCTSVEKKVGTPRKSPIHAGI